MTHPIMCDCGLPPAIPREAMDNNTSNQSNSTSSSDSLYSTSSLEEMLYWRIRECREYQARSRYTSSEESLDRPNRRNDAHCRNLDYLFCRHPSLDSVGHECENHSQSRMQDTRYTPSPTPNTSLEDIRVGPAQNGYSVTPPSEYEERHEERLNPDFIINHLETLITPIQNSTMSEITEDMGQLQIRENTHSQ